jgi:hypothetical protein
VCGLCLAVVSGPSGSAAIVSGASGSLTGQLVLLLLLLLLCPVCVAA